MKTLRNDYPYQVAMKLAEKYEYTYYADESAVIADIVKIVNQDFDKTQAAFILNDKDFVGETLDDFFFMTGTAA